MQKLENVLKEIESVGNIQFSSYTKPLIAVEDVIKIIRAHIPLENDAEIARSSRDNDGWISVEERLPDNNENVLVTTDMGLIASGYIAHGTWITDQEPDYPIAWRPLPEPYRLTQKGARWNETD